MDITALGVQYEDVQGNGVAPELTVTESSPMTAEPRVLGRDSPDRGPVVESREPVEVFGYLQKQGRRLKGWHQRWFEIRGQHMYYFKNNSKKQCLGEIQLHICTGVQPSEVATFGHPFEIVTKERVHILAARTQEDMEKWIDTIRKKMRSRPSSEPKVEVNKVKKWDSFKNTFLITRHRSSSPQPSAPSHTMSLPPAIQTAAPEVSRNKSFLNKFRKVKRDRSSSTGRNPAALKEEEKAARPLSEEMTYSQEQQKLVAALVDPPVAVSVPNSPLSRKRQMSGPVRSERSSLSPTPAPTPGTSSGRTTPRSTPDRELKHEPSPPRLTSTPMTTEKETTPSPTHSKVTFATPRPLVTESAKQHQPGLRKQSSPISPLASEENALPDILTKPLVWDELKVLLDSIEEGKPLFTESLPPRDEPWAERESPIDQLREFLAVCP